jgi:hypothetical protein
MSRISTMQPRGSVRVGELSQNLSAKPQRAIEAFESSLFAKDREAVLNRKLFALRAAEFLCEIIRAKAATAEAIAQAEPERFEEILKLLPKDSETRLILQPARKASAVAAKSVGLIVHPIGTRTFRDTKRGTTSTNEETMLEASLIGEDGRKLSEIRTLKTWARWLALIDAYPEIRQRVAGQS